MTEQYRFVAECCCLCVTRHWNRTM